MDTNYHSKEPPKKNGIHDIAIRSDLLDHHGVPFGPTSSTDRKTSRQIPLELNFILVTSASSIPFPGTSKVLTTIIDGEALLNDGSAIVIYEVLLAMLIPGNEMNGELTAEQNRIDSSRIDSSLLVE